MRRTYNLDLTTQGPTYPPSELMNEDGDFVVIGVVNREGRNGSGVDQSWGGAIVSAKTLVPEHGDQSAYKIVREIGTRPETLTAVDRDMTLYTLPLPLPCNNYDMLFAPEQEPKARQVSSPSYPLHEVPIPDLRPEDGRTRTQPVTLGQWLSAEGNLEVTADSNSAEFRFEFQGLLPNALYTVMSLREHDLSPSPSGPHRPGPLGIPNVLVTDELGNGRYYARLPNPFDRSQGRAVRPVVNVVLLWMSTLRNYQGAIGHFGLGGDIHAQMKLSKPTNFEEFSTSP